MKHFKQQSPNFMKLLGEKTKKKKIGKFLGSDENNVCICKFKSQFLNNLIWKWSLSSF